MASNIMSSVARAANFALLREGLNLTQSRRLRRFVEGAKRPRDVQLALLRSIMAKNANTVFGKNMASRKLLTPPGTAGLCQCRPTRTCAL